MNRFILISYKKFYLFIHLLYQIYINVIKSLMNYFLCIKVLKIQYLKNFDNSS